MTLVDSLLSAALWFVVVSGVTFLTYPITFVICRGLPDRGLSLYRPLGMVIAILPVWWLGNLSSFPFSGAAFFASALVIGAISWTYAVLRLDVLEFLRERRRRWLAIELATALLFFLYVVVRGFRPDIWGTEKPMELAFLSAAIQADSLPVPDPWFAGEPINYYYFGYATLALFAKLTGLPGGVVFSLGLATTFALATVAVGGLAANISERIANSPTWMPAFTGVLTGFLLMFSGNMHAARELVRAPSDTLSAGWWDGIGWSSSRIIEDTGFDSGTTRTVISEFPAFSWILGDLHPHVLAYPWLILAIGLLANYLFTAIRRDRMRHTLAAAAAIGASVGVLYSSNSWDVAIIGLLGGVVLLQAARSAGWFATVLSAGALATSALITALPFALNYVPAAGDTDPHVSSVLRAIPLGETVIATVGYVHWDRTSSGELLLAHGGFLALLSIVAVWLWREDRSDARFKALAVLAPVSALFVMSIIFETPALLVVGVPLLLLSVLTARSDLDVASQFVLLLLVAALGVIILLEFFYIRDPFGDRMNTVFKIYFQLWAVMSLTLGILVPVALRRLRQVSPSIQRSLIALLVVAVIASSVYAPVSAYRWYDGFSNWQGIDGTAYIDRVQPAEAAAMDWIRDNAGPSTVLLEAPGCSYGSDSQIPHNRMSMATGVPAVIGWDGHQFQWRRQQPELVAEIGLRIEQARTVYEEPTSVAAGEYLDFHDVTHVVVGVHEVTGYARCDHGPPYDGDGLDELEQLGLLPVFQEDGVVIFERQTDADAN